MIAAVAPFLCMRSAWHRLGWAAVLAGVLLLTPATITAQPAIPQVLLLQSFDRGNMTLDHFTANFRVELDQRLGRPVNVVEVAVSLTALAGAPEQALVDYIGAAFAGRPKPDLIMAVAGPASAFARKYRQEIFPDTPLLLAAVDTRYLADGPLGDNETAVTVDANYPGFVNDVLRLLPRTKRVLMVTGSGQIAKFWRPQLEREFKEFGDRLSFVWSDTLSLPAILRQSAALPPDSAIFYLAVGTDAAGTAYADERVLGDLHATASAPLFGIQSVYMGTGVVGGSLTSIDDLSRDAADAAARLLSGTPPARVRTAMRQRGRPVFDWRELQRWRIPESRLPPGSTVLYRRPSLWREYRTEVLSAAGVLLVQSLLIVGLLYQRRERQRAEFESRKNLALAADTSRRTTMSALTSSISHEIGQPISAMMHNAHALQMMIAAGRATPAICAEILSDIETQGLRANQIIDRHRAMLRSRQLEKQPIDLHGVVKESLALVAHDMTARSVEASVTLSPDPCIVNGDPVLLQQVLVNLLINGMDAMAETAPGRRRLAIRTAVRDTDLELSVRDGGAGLPPHLNGSVFTPFVTTKSHGLGIGLTIAQTIVRAHDGEIDAQNNPDGGATFTVRLPRTTARPGLDR